MRASRFSWRGPILDATGYSVGQEAPLFSITPAIRPLGHRGLNDIGTVVVEWTMPDIIDVVMNLN